MVKPADRPASIESLSGCPDAIDPIGDLVVAGGLGGRFNKKAGRVISPAAHQPPACQRQAEVVAATLGRPVARYQSRGCQPTYAAEQLGSVDSGWLAVRLPANQLAAGMHRRRNDGLAAARAQLHQHRPRIVLGLRWVNEFLGLDQRLGGVPVVRSRCAQPAADQPGRRQESRRERDGFPSIKINIDESMGRRTEQRADVAFRVLKVLAKLGLRPPLVLPTAPAGVLRAARNRDRRPTSARIRQKVVEPGAALGAAVRGDAVGRV